MEPWVIDLEKQVAPKTQDMFVMVTRQREFDQRELGCLRNNYHLSSRCHQCLVEVRDMQLLEEDDVAAAVVECFFLHYDAKRTGSSMKWSS